MPGPEGKGRGSLPELSGVCPALALDTSAAAKTTVALALAPVFPKIASFRCRKTAPRVLVMPVIPVLPAPPPQRNPDGAEFSVVN